MKRPTIVLICAVLLVTGIFVTSCGHHPHHHRRDPDSLLRRMDNRVKQLDLTADQQTQYNKIRERFKSDLEKDMTDMRKLPDQISSKLSSEDPNMEEIADLLKTNMSELPAIRDKYIDYFVEFYHILDEKQQETVIKHFSRRMKRIQHRIG